MGIHSSFAMLVLSAVVAAGTTDPGEIPADPIDHRAPDYPAACLPLAGESGEPQTVVVNFDVTKDGMTENVRVVESTDPCFEESAIAAVRRWTYEPRRVNGDVRPQTDLETTFTFVFEETTQAEDFDARPLLRVPPQYPERCVRHAERRESVVIQFDVTTEGTTENIEALESTNSCFEKAAERSVARWRYRPKLVSGEPVPRKGVVTQITFELADDVPPEFEVRNVVRRRLKRALRSLRRKDDPQKILTELAAIEAEYGDSFSHAELRTFHQIRAVARIEAGDYAGALDDLRAVKRTGLAGEATEAIDKTIAQLETVLAAQSSAADTVDDGSEKRSPE